MISLNPNYLPRPHLQMPPTDQLGGWADKTRRIHSSHSSQLNDFYLIRSFKKLASKTSFKQLVTFRNRQGMHTMRIETIPMQ